MVVQLKSQFLPHACSRAEPSHPEHLHHFVAKVIDDLHGNAAGCRFVKGPGSVAFERGPGFRVDLGLESGLERAVGIVRAEEIGVADEEALFVVVGVNEPAGNAIGAVAADFAGLRMEHVHTVHLHAEFAVLFRQEGDVWLTEDDEEVTLAGVLEVLGHVEVRVHAGLKHGDATEFTELCGVGLVVEGAGDQHIEPGIASLTGGGDEVGALDGAELGADEDGGALLRLAFQVAAFGASELPRSKLRGIKT